MKENALRHFILLIHRQESPMKYIFLGLLALRYQLLTSVLAAPLNSTAEYLPDVVNNTISLPSSTKPLSPLR